MFCLQVNQHFVLNISPVDAFLSQILTPLSIICYSTEIYIVTYIDLPLLHYFFYAIKGLFAPTFGAPWRQKLVIVIKPFLAQIIDSENERQIQGLVQQSKTKEKYQL